MILSERANQFKDNRFSFWEWSAPILQTPEVVLQNLKELHLEGRVVKDIVAIGMGYGWTVDNILEMSYHTLSVLFRNVSEKKVALLMTFHKHLGRKRNG